MGAFVQEDASGSIVSHNLRNQCQLTCFPFRRSNISHHRLYVCVLDWRLLLVCPTDKECGPAQPKEPKSLSKHCSLPHPGASEFDSRYSVTLACRSIGNHGQVTHVRPPINLSLFSTFDQSRSPTDDFAVGVRNRH